MEEGLKKDIKKIVITGAESTGKTTLCKELSHYYNGICVDEYAREYVEKLNRDYTYHDVEIIAKKHLQNVETAIKQTHNFVFIDTYLIVIKIWFTEVFKRYPYWIEDEINKSQIDLYLLCNTDIPWIADKVRENGDERREYLNYLYIEQLRYYKLPFKVINGQNNTRLENAVQILDTYFNNIK